MKLVKLYTSDFGEKYKKKVWCIVHPVFNDPATLCKMEYYGIGQSGCVFEEKDGTIKDVTCPDCLNFINIMKYLK